MGDGDDDQAHRADDGPTDLSPGRPLGEGHPGQDDGEDDLRLQHQRGQARRHAEVHAEIQQAEHDPREVVGLIERGTADLGIVHDWNSLPLDVPPSLTRRHLLTDAADVLVPADHPIAGAASVQALQLARERWVSTPAGSICHEWLHQMFGLHGARPDVRYFDGSFATHVALVEQRVAVALVPRLGRDRLPDEVRAVPVTDPVPRREVSAIWRRASADNPIRRHVQAELEALVAGLG